MKGIVRGGVGRTVALSTHTPHSPNDDDDDDDDEIGGCEKGWEGLCEGEL